MVDQITQVVQNLDGSWTFNFTFDNGSGTLTNTTIPVPPGTNDVSAARSAAIATAKEQKQAWLAVIANQEEIGTVSR